MTLTKILVLRGPTILCISNVYFIIHLLYLDSCFSSYLQHNIITYKMQQMLMVYIPFHSVPPHTIFRWQRICMYVTTTSYFYVRIYNAFFSRDLLSWHKICQSIHTATFCRSGAKLILNPEPEQDGNCIVFYSSLFHSVLCLSIWVYFYLPRCFLSVVN